MTEPIENIKVTFRKESSTANLLNYAKIRKSRPFSAQDIRHVLAGKFPNVYEASRSINVLVKNKCLTENSDGKFHITEHGENVLVMFAYKDVQPATKHSMQVAKLRKQLLDQEDMDLNKELGL